MLRVKTGK